MPQPLRVVETVDPRTLIQQQVGDFLPHINPIGTGVLIVLYERGKQHGDIKTAGGIIVPEVKLGALSEDKYQGKVGLVIRTGPAAFLEDANHKWADRLPQEGDWVLCRHSDMFMFDLPNDRRGAIVSDVHVMAILDKPDIVW